MAGSEWSLPVSRNIIINQQYGADTIIHARERDKKQQEKKKKSKEYMVNSPVFNAAKEVW